MLVGAGLCAAPLWAPVLLRQSSYFAVRSVQVVGARYLAPATVARALGLAPSANVWSPLGPLTARMRAMPGIVDASVTRDLPSTLVVRVRERQPIAMADGPDGMVALDENGQPLPYDVTRPAVDAPFVRRADPVLARALAAVQQVDPALFADVSAADLDGGVVLVLRGGRVRLSTPVDPDQVRAVSAVRRELAGRGAGWSELDGRFAALVVVRRANAAPGTQGARS